MKRSGLIFVALLAMSSASAQPLPPSPLPIAIPAPLPYPAASAVFQWDYVCPQIDGNGCGALVSSGLAGATNHVRQLTVVLVMFPQGNEVVPAYFYWLNAPTPMPPDVEIQKGFVHNPASFFVTVYGNMVLQYAAAPPR